MFRTDYTFCMHKDCAKTDCFRHQCHLEPNHIVSMADMRGQSGCAIYSKPPNTPLNSEKYYEKD